MSLSCSDTEIVINQTTNISTQEEKYQEKDDLNRNYSDNCVNRMHNLEKETNTSENDDYELNFSQSTDSTKINVHQDKIRSRYKNNLKEQNESDSSNELMDSTKKFEHQDKKENKDKNRYKCKTVGLVYNFTYSKNKL